MWLNRAIKTLWPVYNEAIAKMAIEQAKPQIDAALKGVSPHFCYDCEHTLAPDACILGSPLACIILQVYDTTVSCSVVLGQRGWWQYVLTYPSAIRLVGWHKRVISPIL